MTVEKIPVAKFGYVQRQTLDWFKEHARLLMAGGAFLMVLIVGAAQISGWSRGDSQRDFVAAERVYQKWEGSKKSLAILEKLIRRHPELHAKYDGAIAQKLLTSSEHGLAKSYASAALKRTEFFSPYHTQFSKDSLLITEGKLSEALADAKGLKKSMQEDDAFWENRSSVVRHGSLLYAYNLLRIAMLEKVTGSPEGELAAWEELKMNAGWEGFQPASKAYDPEAYMLIQQNFQKQDVTLQDFIKYRENLILKR